MHQRVEKDKTGNTGRNSELDSNSHVDNNSIASFSALGGLTSSKIDIKRVELINENL